MIDEDKIKIFAYIRAFLTNENLPVENTGKGEIILETMNLQESFERSNFIEFVPSDNIAILYFQHEAIRDEFYEELRMKTKETPLKLEIKLIDPDFVGIGFTMKVVIEPVKYGN